MTRRVLAFQIVLSLLAAFLMNTRTRNNVVTLGGSVVPGLSITLALVAAAMPLPRASAAPAAPGQDGKGCCYVAPGGKGDYLVPNPNGKRHVWASTLARRQLQKESALAVAAASAGDSRSTGALRDAGQVPVWVANEAAAPANVPAPMAPMALVSACRVGAAC